MYHITTRRHSQRENLRQQWSPMKHEKIISLFASELGLSIRCLEILQKWLWLKSRITDCNSSQIESFNKKCDTSRVESPLFLTVSRATKNWDIVKIWLASLTPFMLSLQSENRRRAIYISLFMNEKSYLVWHRLTLSQCRLMQSRPIDSKA